MKSSEILLDLNAALARLEGDRDLLASLIEMFFEDSVDLMNQLREAVANQDAEATRRVAHSLKGLVSNFNATACSDAAHAMEIVGMEKSFGDAAVKLELLERKLEQLQVTLREAGF